MKLPQKENNNNNNDDDDDSHDGVLFHHHHYYVVGTIVSEIFGLNHHHDKEDMAQFENLVLESVEGGTTNTLCIAQSHLGVLSIIMERERESTNVQFRRKKEKKERTKQESHKVP